MKQKIITAQTTSQLEQELHFALAHGWLIHQVAALDKGPWIAILYRNDDERTN